MQWAIRRLCVSRCASHYQPNIRWARASIKRYSSGSDEEADGFTKERVTNTTVIPSAINAQRSDAAAKSDVRITHLTGLSAELGAAASASHKTCHGQQGQVSGCQPHEKEAALDLSKANGSGLIASSPATEKDIQLWLEKLRFQHRHNGAQGIEDTFKKMIELDFVIPSAGPKANEIWIRILQAALQNEAFLEDVLKYAALQRATTGRSYPKMYRTIIGSKLRADPINATKWHDKLGTTFPPCAKDYELLLAQAIEHNNVKTFEKIFARHQIHPMYDIIVSQLCLAQKYETAFRWHFLLFESKDFPSKFESLRSLLSHYSRMKDNRKVEKLITSTLASGHKTLQDGLNEFARSQSQLPISQEILDRQLGAVHGISPKVLSDSLCARFFATKLIRVETVIDGLQMMATECIGPESVREIVIRDDCDPESICRHLDLLKNAGIAIDSSKYSTMVRQAAVRNSTKFLRCLIESDVHPAVYEDLNALEELYTMHYDRQEEAQAQMLLAAMTSEVSHALLEAHSINIRLRCYLRLQKFKHVTSLLERMKQDSIPLTPKSSRHLRVLLFQKRRHHRLDLPSVMLKDIHLVAAVMRQTLQSGGEVPILAWREILRRFGMFGFLREFRELALWLVDHYSNYMPQAHSLSSAYSTRDSVRGVLGPQTQPLTTTRAVDATGVQSRQDTSKNESTKLLLHQIFTKHAQIGIVAWGFQQDAKHNMKSHRFAVPQAHPTQWTWGLLLLQELYARGVEVQKDLVAKACNERLGQLFGSQTSSRRLNRHAKSMNNERLDNGDVRAQYGAYVQRMEDIWGKDLFVRHAQDLEVGGEGRQMHGDRDEEWRVENSQDGRQQSE